VGNLEHLSKYRKIPVLVCAQEDALQQKEVILFITLDIKSLFEFSRSCMCNLSQALNDSSITSYTFGTRMLTPDKINNIVKEIGERKKQEKLKKEEQSKQNPQHLFLVPKPKN